ncbi:MAG: hypothetical protein ACTSO7_00240 [Candidatus Heimdallarchaeota archaeon]
MSLKIAATIEKENQEESDLGNQSIFLKQMFTNNEITLSTEQIEDNPIIWCDKCGYPQKPKQLQQTSRYGNKSEITNDDEVIYEDCLLCRREKILDGVLISSYVITAAIFIVCFVGVIYDQIGLDICLMIGCLEIIFLVYLGRWVEDAVFLKMTKEERLVAALYRYSVSGEIQALETARKDLLDMPSDGFNHEILKGLLQVGIFQANGLPYYWYSNISKQMNVSIDEIPQILLEQIRKPGEKNFISRIVKDAPLTGVSKLMQLAIVTKNNDVLDELVLRVENELGEDVINSSWYMEFYLFKKYYNKVLFDLQKEEVKEEIDELMIDFEEPKVPTIDVIGKSKSIINRNPFIRYIIRIFTYILIAFIVSLLFSILD